MKGKSQFTKEEAREIEDLIALKLQSENAKQKGIRAKIRRRGFYASDFGLNGGYTIADFTCVAIIGIKVPFAFSKSKKNAVQKKPKSPQTKQKPISAKYSDETYIINLCDQVLKQTAIRQHRFDILKGDSGTKLPVDAYYPTLNLVVEYYERQHSESVPHFNKRMTVSGISRGEQRKRYDKRRRIELPKNGLKLVIFDYTDFAFTSNKCLMRNKLDDIGLIKKKLNDFLR